MSPLKTVTIHVDLDGKILPFYMAADLEVLFDDPADPDQVPCWAEAWPAARGLGAFILQGSRLEGKKVLELGAGVGLPGVACGLQGASVTFSDFQPLALHLCEANARLHRLENYNLLLADWRTFSCNEHFDLVLASDIAYEPRLLPSLKAVLLAVLKPGGSIYFSHPGRPVTFSFIEEILAGGSFFQERFLIPVRVVDDPVRKTYEIYIHRLHLKAAAGKSCNGGEFSR
ncbi:MAG: methyltransferase domain-containing protein [Firmicutes bacterium]|nr:methyltransferase domain-containing protein [Bacillota bacterium]